MEEAQVVCFGFEPRTAEGKVTPILSFSLFLSFFLSLSLSPTHSLTIKFSFVIQLHARYALYLLQVGTCMIGYWYLYQKKLQPKCDAQFHKIALDRQVNKHNLPEANSRSILPTKQFIYLFLSFFLLVLDVFVNPV